MTSTRRRLRLRNLMRLFFTKRACSCLKNIISKMTQSCHRLIIFFSLPLFRNKKARPSTRIKKIQAKKKIHWKNAYLSPSSKTCATDDDSTHLMKWWIRLLYQLGNLSKKETYLIGLNDYSEIANMSLQIEIVLIICICKFPAPFVYFIQRVSAIEIIFSALSFHAVFHRVWTLLFISCIKPCHLSRTNISKGEREGRQETDSMIFAHFSVLS